MDTYKIFYNTSKDVYYHIAVEKYLLETLEPHTNVLYLWQSSGAVVVGKHQNIWKECNYKVCLDNNIKIARRISGGGAVYQDLGNLNFSFISSKESCSLDNNFAILLNMLHRLGINVKRNKNNNLTVDGKKILGSSFSIKKNAVLHNASLLIDTDLSLLHKVLKPSFSTIESRSVESHHSAVVSCCAVSPGPTVKKIIKRTVQEFQRVYDTREKMAVNSPEVSPDGIAEYYREITDNSWNFGRNPFWSVFPNDDGYNDNTTLIKILNDGKINTDTFYHRELIEEPVT